MDDNTTNLEKNQVKCSTCDNIMIYKHYKSLLNAIKNKQICRKCMMKNANKKNKIGIFQKECPTCKKIITLSNKYRLELSIKNNSECKSCSNSGEKNGMFNKKHTQETKDKISKTELEKYANGYISPNLGKPCTEERKQNIIKYYETHEGTMTGKTCYGQWLKKYGKEVADKKMEEYKKLQSINSSGKNNPMYGKPSPNGSGQGWKGWYKNFFFRSLRELSYIIYLDENNIKWESAEQQKYKIEYFNPFGIPRTYRPDFLIENKKLIEIKPLKLHKTPLILKKIEAAKKFCAKNNLEFEIIDFDITPIKIKKYLDEGIVKFDRDYKEKFLEYIKS